MAKNPEQGGGGNTPPPVELKITVESATGGQGGDNKGGKKGGDNKGTENKADGADAPKTTEKATTSKEATTEEKPKTTETTTPSRPTPVNDPNNPDRNPFHKKVIDDEMRERTIPTEPSIPLSRERNYTNEAEIHRLIEASLSGTYEQNMRDRRYHELFGDAVGLANFRSYQEGVGHWVRVDDGNGAFHFDLVDSDFTFDHQTGELRYNVGHSIGRRAVNVGAKIGVKAAIATGAALAVSFFTGPIGWATGGAIVGRVVMGSGVGRAVGETARYFLSREKKYHEEEEISLIRYYKKQRELAQIAAMYWGPYVAGATFDAINPAEPLSEDQWQLRRTQAIKDLVNFTYSMEEATVEIKYRGNTPVVDTQPQAPGVARAGTEVVQPSEVDIDPERIRLIRDRLAAERARWEKIAGLSEFIGGAGWTAHWLLQGGASDLAHRVFDGFKDMFNRGEVVRHVDINNDWHFHNIQQLFEGNQPAEQVFHYNSLGEQMADAGQGASVIEGASQHGSHLLGESASRIDAALYNKALFNVSAQVTGAFAALLARFGLDHAQTNAFKEQDDNTRAHFREWQENRRRRNVPGESPEQLMNLALENGTFLPQTGEHWMQNVDGQWIELYVRNVLIDKSHAEASKVIFETLDDRGTLPNFSEPVPILDVIGRNSPYYRVGRPPLENPIPKRPDPTKKPETSPSAPGDGGPGEPPPPKPEDPKKKPGEDEEEENKKKPEDVTPPEDEKKPVVQIQTKVWNKEKKELEPWTTDLKNGQIFQINFETKSGKKGWMYIEIIEAPDKDGNILWSEFKTTKDKKIERDKTVKSMAPDAFKSWFESTDNSFNAPNFKAFEKKLNKES